ncbi:MAG TPA: Na+/H+ antiporter subunit D [Pseudogracilibacillus sp.]|nr:Na+/H+ antiporter subunit D [Pseudogracilibacillus sp.]
MTNIVVLPMAIPLITAILLVFLKERISLQRTITFISLLINTIISFYLLHHIYKEGIVRIDFGSWQPPFGITFVADSFAMLLVLTTNIVSFLIVLYAFHTIGTKRERLYFYPFVHFLIAGVNGSFLTGDLFNLFVTFEVMLLASYVLLTLGASREQLVESLKYIAINVISSSLFLIAIAYLYGSLGTLNMAHLSVRIAEVGQTPLLTVISLLFLVVFSLKSGLLLYHWLPGSYSTPPTAIAALFGALLTKVGIYAIIRMFTLMFYHKAEITHTIIGVLAGLTLIGGMVGAIAYRNLRYIVSYNVIISVGFILIGVAVMDVTALSGTIFYLVHDMFVKALLFLLIGTIIYIAKVEHFDEISGLIRYYPTLGWSFFITVLALAGIPPLSGFLGKILIAQGTITTKSFSLLTLGFLSSFIVLYSLLRIFMNVFWGETIIEKEETRSIYKRLYIPILTLIAISFSLGIGSEFLAPYIENAATVLMNPELYIDAVLEK